MSSFNSKLTKLILAEVEAAFLKAATPVEGEVFPVFATAEEARDEFRDRFLADLAERLGVTTKPKTKKTKEMEATATVTIPEAEHAQEVAQGAAPVEEKKERKPRSPMTPEKKAAMKAKRDATLAAKKGVAPAPVEAVVAAPAVPAEAAPAPAVDSPKEKKKRGPMTEEAKAAMKAKREATLAAKAGDGAEKKAKAAEDSNLVKVDPTWRKHLKSGGKAAKVEVTKEMETELLSYLNGLTKEEFNTKKAEEHISTFLGRSNAAAAPVVEDKAPADPTVVEFEGKDYFVNEETKRVYEGEGEQDEEGGWTNYKPVGYVGMAAFTEMTLE